METECLCDRCTALCCRYFALEIDEPETSEDFDDIRWYLAHENVHIFIEDDEWYLSVQTRCQYLQDDNRCGIYEDRPKMCREYTTDNCDYYIGQYDFQQYFTKPEELEAYAQTVLGEKYRRYVVRQRMKNIGADESHHDKPKANDVLSARRRPRIKGHPSHRRSPHSRSKKSFALVGISIGGSSPAKTN